MKKMIFLLAIITIIAHSNPQKLMGEDCKFLCPEIEWQESGVWSDYIIDPLCQCSINIYWSYRYVDCEGMELPWCHFKIDKIEFQNCPYNCPILNLSIYEQVQYALMFILKQIAIDKPCFAELEPGECSSNIAITYASCWKTEDYPYNNKFTEPCEGEHCCTEVWKLCKYSNGAPKPPERIATIGINPICPNQNCIAVCEEYNPEKNTSQPNEHFISEFGDKVEIYPNPTDITLYINFNSITEGLHTFEVYDLTGNLVYTEDFNKSQNDISMQFNFTKLTNGAYNFVIKSDGKNRINGKFNIIK